LSTADLPDYNGRSEDILQTLGRIEQLLRASQSRQPENQTLDDLVEFRQRVSKNVAYGVYVSVRSYGFIVISLTVW
jgi:hypothetical protein